jgi:hypothetical protein
MAACQGARGRRLVATPDLKVKVVALNYYLLSKYFSEMLRFQEMPDPQNSYLRQTAYMIVICGEIDSWHFLQYILPRISLISSL